MTWYGDNNQALQLLSEELGHQYKGRTEGRCRCCRCCHGFKPRWSPEFFSGFFTQLQKIAIITARIILHLISYPQFTYDLFHMHQSRTYHCHANCHAARKAPIYCALKMMERCRTSDYTIFARAFILGHAFFLLYVTSCTRKQIPRYQLQGFHQQAADLPVTYAHKK